MKREHVVGTALGREVVVTPHAAMRWIERVGGLGLGPLRDLTTSLGQAGRASDRAMERLLGHMGFDLMPLRGEMLRMIRLSEIDARMKSAHVRLPSGHVVVMVLNNAGGWTVTTVLSAEPMNGRCRADTDAVPVDP